jgi:hypothetical protein
MRLYLLALSAVAFAQFTPKDTVPLPPGKSDAAFDLKLSPPHAPHAVLNPLPLRNEKGEHLRPQPTVKASIKDGLAHLDLSGLHFWGAATLDLQVTPGGLTTFHLQRGPFVSPTALNAQPGAPLQIWLYNPDTVSLPLRWRLASSVDFVCGPGPKTACAQPSDWGTLTVPPATSKAISFSLPNRWFSTSTPRQALLELYFGDDEKAPLLSVPVSLQLQFDPLFLFPDNFIPVVFRTLVTIFWVSLGAAALMFGQVVIPGYRRCAKLQTQIDLLDDRFKSIGSRVGTRLYSRCSRDIENIQNSLLMTNLHRWNPVRLLYRILLFANTTELDRHDGLIKAIDTRIRLTERLDQVRLEQLSEPTQSIPPSILRERDENILAVELILSRQYISDADAKSASDLLDACSSSTTLRRTFPDRLEARIARICKELQCEPWASLLPGYLQNFPSASKLCSGNCTAPTGGWSDAALVQRDLDATRLELLYQLITLPNPESIHGKIVVLLQSGSLAKITEARSLINQLAEGIFVNDIKRAFLEQDWDTWYEPDAPTEGEVISVSLRFRDDRLNRAAARERFHCFWLTNSNSEALTSDRGTTAGEQYETGWHIQLVRKPGQLILAPEIYLDGQKISANPDEIAPPKPVELTIGPRPLPPIRKRLARAFADSIVTAIVPVVTVALTQTQTNADLTWTTLISLGVTSQAIRSAILPETVNASAARPATQAPAAPPQPKKPAN